MIPGLRRIFPICLLALTSICRQHASAATAEPGSLEDVRLLVAMHASMEHIEAICRERGIGFSISSEVSSDIPAGILGVLRGLAGNSGHLTWADPQSTLMWAAQDNGRDVNWNEASAFCQNLALGGYRNWRLPAIGELEGIYDPTPPLREAQANAYYSSHVKGAVGATSARLWAGAVTEIPGRAWYFSFVFMGMKSYDDIGYSNGFRALCVRSN